MRSAWILVIPVISLPSVAFSQEEAGWFDGISNSILERARRSQEMITESVEGAIEASRQARDWTQLMLEDIGERVAPAYDRTVEAVSVHSNTLRQQTASAFSLAYDYSFDTSNAIIESLSQNLTSGATYLLEVGSDGGLQIYEASSGRISAVSDWSQERISQLQEIDYCEVDLIDYAGGLAAGVTVTSLYAGVNITGVSLIAIPTMTGWLPVLAPLTSPAIPAGVTLAAGAGVLIYASTKGYCWMISPADEEIGDDTLEIAQPAAESID